MRLLSLVSVALVALVAASISVAWAAPFEGRTRVLVFLEKEADRPLFSSYFSLLEDRGYRLTVAYANSEEEIAFASYGEYNYDQLLLFAPSVASFRFASTQDIIEYINRGGNVVLAASSKVGLATRELASQCGVEFHADKTVVLDHFHALNDKHTLISSSQIIPSPVMFPKHVDRVLFEGIGHTISSNELVLSTLVGESTSYSFFPESEISDYPFSAGHITGLVSSLQAKNNARVTIAGSLSMFQNSLFEKKFPDGKASDTKSFVTQLTEWTFQERGMLRVVNTTHHKVGEVNQPLTYRIKDEITYDIFVQQYVDGEWVPFSTDDMQLEAKMLDPYIRMNLIADGTGHFHQTFMLPDVYGVYTFKVSYARVGRSFLNAADLVPVQQLRHDQYERFIPAAYPHYISAFSLMFTFLLFSLVFLYYREPGAAGKVKTT